jgi:hypothetical protein
MVSTSVLEFVQVDEVLGLAGLVFQKFHYADVGALERVGARGLAFFYFAWAICNYM